MAAGGPVRSRLSVIRSTRCSHGIACRAIELLPWLIAVAVYFVFGDYLPLGSQILIMILFALSLDLVLGYAGIVTLGHSAFFGVGAYAAGIYAAHVSGEPLSGLVVAALRRRRCRLAVRAGDPAHARASRC